MKHTNGKKTVDDDKAVNFYLRVINLAEGGNSYSSDKKQKHLDKLLSDLTSEEKCMVRKLINNELCIEDEGGKTNKKAKYYFDFIKDFDRQNPQEPVGKYSKQVRDSSEQSSSGFSR